MKRKILIVLGLFIACSVAVGALTTPQMTYDSSAKTGATRQYWYERQINSVTVDDTDLASDTSYWDAIESVFLPIPAEWSIVELAFYGYGDGVGIGSPDGATFTAIIYACRKWGGAKKVGQLAGTVGAQQMSVNPVDDTSLFAGAADPNYCWADTLTVAIDDWVSDIQLSGEGGNDGIATATFDLNGHWGFYVYITDMTGQSVTSVTCVATGYD